MSSTFAALLKSCCEVVEALPTEPMGSPVNTLQAAPQTLAAMCNNISDSPAEPKATLKKLLLKQEVRVDVVSMKRQLIKPSHGSDDLLCIGCAAVCGRPVWLGIGMVNTQL
jgi:hypothetical protein